MLAILIPAQELFCYGEGQLPEIDNPMFLPDMFTKEMLVALKEPTTQLMLLTEYDPQQPNAQATYTVRQLYGRQHVLSADMKLVQAIEEALAATFGLHLNVKLCRAIDALSGEFAPQDDHWTISLFTECVLFARWSCEPAQKWCENSGIEYHTLQSSFIAAANTQRALAQFYNRSMVHHKFGDENREALLLIDIDETVLNNADSALFMRTVLNPQVMAVLGHFLQMLDANHFKTRCLAMTARNPVEEHATWQLQPVPVTAIPVVVEAVRQQGLRLEFHKDLSFSNPRELVPELKQLKLEHLLTLICQRQLNIEPGTLVVLTDDCPLETGSARAQAAATKLADHYCSVIILPVQRHGYVESIATLPSLFAARGGKVVPVKPAAKTERPSLNLSV